MNMKKLLSLLLAVVMLLSMVACGNSEEATENTDEASASTGESVSYSVSVKSAGGMALENVEVYVYAADDLSDMKGYDETDAEGKAEFKLEKGGDYAIVVDGAPNGYEVAESYSFTGNSADIVLSSSLIMGEGLSGVTLGVGDVMYDFSVMLPDGSSVSLAEMLEEKEMVLINFWYSTCGPCASEFPYMEEAYQMYQDKVGIIALNPLEDNATVEAYQKSMGLSFPMAACQPTWSTTFNVTGYPTSIVVDRYGVITLVEAGALVSLSYFTSAFEHFTADDYQQALHENFDSLKVTMKPTYEMPASEEIAAVLHSGEVNATYHGEEDEDSAEYSWPFIISEKNGEACLKASNQEIESSFAMLYCDVTLEAGQALGIDYLASTEKGNDAMVVIVDGEDIYQISGVDAEEQWKTCYPCVANEAGTYEVVFAYLKDESTNEGDDTVYLKNMRVVNVEDIDAATYIPCNVASSEDGFEYTYEEIFYNEADGYYHVGSENGPLLLANLMEPSEFNQETSIHGITVDGDVTMDGASIYEKLVDYCSYASNSSLYGYCTVNQELAEMLKIVDEQAGFDDEDENEWLRLCMYYQHYGTEEILEDPIKGLATFSAYEAKLGKDIETNVFYYDRIIMPRGKLAKFVPSQSGVYRITSDTDYTEGVEAWIFDENGELIYTHEPDERMFNDPQNCSMVYYMEAGKAYYLDIAFWDPYNVGYIYYDVEYLGGSYQLFRACAPGYFTYDTDATGDAMYDVIAGGIDVILGEDGKYYEDLGLDANGNQKYGSLIYADFTGLTSIFSTPIATVKSYDENGNVIVDEEGNEVMIKGMIEKGGFDFSKSETDLEILAYMQQNDNDVDATIAYLKEYWGEDYDGYADIYQLDDIFAGRFHGEGEDLTAEMEGYLDDIITSGGEEVRGCVVVTERLAEILQMLMDKYTFEGVDDSWIKLCYYYDNMNAEG